MCGVVRGDGLSQYHMHTYLLAVIVLVILAILFVVICVRFVDIMITIFCDSIRVFRRCVRMILTFIDSVILTL